MQHRREEQNLLSVRNSLIQEMDRLWSRAFRKQTFRAFDQAAQPARAIRDEIEQINKILHIRGTLPVGAV